MVNSALIRNAECRIFLANMTCLDSTALIALPGLGRRAYTMAGQEFVYWLEANGLTSKMQSVLQKQYLTTGQTLTCSLMEIVP